MVCHVSLKNAVEKKIGRCLSDCQYRMKNGCVSSRNQHLVKDIIFYHYFLYLS